MFTSLQETLVHWFKSTDDRKKLQHSYLALASATLIIAGLVGLVEYQYGQVLSQIAAGLIVVFLVNAVAWALLESFVFTRLNAKSRQTKRK